VAMLVARWRSGGVLAVAPQYRDGRGHPVLFGRECFAALCALEGDQGARSVLTALGDDLAMVLVDEPTPLDVDSPDVLAQLVKRLTVSADSPRDGR
jgi:molybdenum cofactor cytidylyltransferase